MSVIQEKYYGWACVWEQNENTASGIQLALIQVIVPKCPVMATYDPSPADSTLI